MCTHMPPALTRRNRSSRRTTSRSRQAEQQALQAAWREPTLNSQDALKAEHAEIPRQREHIA
jgi:hypothetical protein